MLTQGETLRLALIVGMPVVALLVIKLIGTRLGWSAELSRKAVHVSLGMACLTFPWLFDRPLPVWILAVTTVSLLFVIRVFPRLQESMGTSLHSVGRISYGDLLFAPAVAAVFHLAHGVKVFHVVPVAILTLADAAGALMGAKWGKHRFATGEGQKSYEGCAAFFVCALFCSVFLLKWLADMSWTDAVLLGATIAILGMMAEAISDRGFDNLVLPLGTQLLLFRFLPLGTDALAWRFAVAAALLALVISSSRWSTLKGGALIAAALLGYGCVAFGPWQCVLPLLALFLQHLWTSRRYQLEGHIVHGLDAVVAVAVASLPWSIAHAYGFVVPAVALAGVSFGVAIYLAELDDSTRREVISLRSQPAASVLKGMVIAGLPGLAWLMPQWTSHMAGWVAIVCGLSWLAVLLSRWVESRREFSSWMLYLRGILALLGSLPALYFVR